MTYISILYKSIATYLIIITYIVTLTIEVNYVLGYRRQHGLHIQHLHYFTNKLKIKTNKSRGKDMKWIAHGIKFSQDSTDKLIARYNSSLTWFTCKKSLTQQYQREAFKRLGSYFGADRVEVKLLNSVDSGTIKIIEFTEAGRGNFLFKPTG